MTYRTDIDGLRALAVLSVIVFHINPAWLPGGFAGVDIFFVISGYLITLHIVQEIDQRRFSLAEFYRRRIKRIAPAMLVVVAGTLIAAQGLLRPVDAERVAESAVWSLASLANVYFWLFLDTGYFAAASEQQPLLHLWSLGVEEQFYIVWPLLLLALAQRRRSGLFVPVALAALVGSFAYGQWVFADHPSFAYYMLPTRAGELLIGALLAHWVHAGHRPPSRAVAEAAAWFGLVLVIGSLLLLSEHHVFPGWRAAALTLGTGLLLYAGLDARVWLARVLSLRPLVMVGLVSYSAYLVHWPMLAFLRYAGVPMTLGRGVAVLVLTLTLAWLIYRFVEQPLRRTRRGALAVFVRQYALPGGALAVLALAAMKMDGYGLRLWVGDYPARLAAVRESVKPPFAHNHVCQKRRVTAADFERADCVVGTPAAAQPRVLLVGDSIAAQYVGLLEAFAAHAGFAFRNVAASACPTIDADPAPFVTAARLTNCRASLATMLPRLADYDVLVFGLAWSYYEWRSAEFLDVFAASMAPLLSDGKRIVLLAKPPVIAGYDRLCREKAVALVFMDCHMAPVPIDADERAGNLRLADYAARTAGVTFLDPTQTLCPGGLCPVFSAAGTPLFYDLSHLTIPAARQLGETIVAERGVPAIFRELAQHPGT